MYGNRQQPDPASIQSVGKKGEDLKKIEMGGEGTSANR